MRNYGIQSAGIPIGQKGAANGVATLDGSAKIPIGQLPAAVAGAVNYKGAWNANTNTPALASGVGTQGDYYVVSVAGTTTLDGISSWAITDWTVYNGTAWEKIDNTDIVLSVAGKTSVVTLDGDDVAETGAKKWAGETGADVTGSNAPQAHKVSHQNGGGDEISVAGLSGELADNQPPKTHTHNVKYTIVFALAPDTDAAVASNVAPSIIAEIAGTIVNARAYSRTAPVGADLIFDINLNGSTIWATQGNRVKVVDGANSGTQTSFDTTAVAVGDRFDLDIDQIGSGTAGKDIVVQLTVQAITS